MSARSSHSRAGFTLLELAVTLAIAGILGALAVASLGAMKSRVSVSSLSRGIHAELQGAQARAMGSAGSVWFIVYVKGVKTPGTGGGFVVYDDPDNDFDFANYKVDGVAQPTEANDVVREQSWFVSAAGEAAAVKVALTSAFNLAPPFETQGAAACTFCSASSAEGIRGAVVFNSEGSARFVNGEGAPLPARFGIFTLSNNPAGGSVEQAAFAIAGPTGLVRVSRP